MEISLFLAPDDVRQGFNAPSKKRLVTDIASFVADRFNLDAGVVFETLWEREKLGSTGVGNGVAIPHGRLASIDQIIGAFVQLQKPIDFESVDDTPVDLVFMLLTPQNAGADHLKALAKVSRVLRSPAVCEKLRAANDKETLYAVLTDTPPGL